MPHAMLQPARRALGRAVLLLVCLGLVAPLAEARPRRPRRARASAVRPAPSPATPLAPGMVIAVDPETGKLVPPSGAQLEKLAAAERTGLLRTDEGLREVRLADGTVMLDLQGRFLEFSVARLGPDGRLRLGCVDEAPALGPWLWGTAPWIAAPPPEER